MSERGVLVTGRGRGGPSAGRLDQPRMLEVPDPGLAEILAGLPRTRDGLWVGGGEPAMRADLPELIRSLEGRGALGLCTDGLAFAGPQAARQAQSWGLRRVRIPLHSARMEAHDWLVELPGAGKRVLRALRCCAEVGLQVQVEITLTRPTMDHLPETVALVAALGATSVIVRRVRCQGPARGQFIALSPRLGLAEPLLERASRAAWSAGIELAFDGFPACALGSAAGQLRPPIRWSAPTADLQALADWLVDPPQAQGCPACAGRPSCPGAPADYVQRFGRTEIDDQCSRPSHTAALPAADPPPTAAPPPRAARAPATRVSFAVGQAARGELRGDPLASVPVGDVPQRCRVAFPAEESTRSIRQRLCRLAQEGSAELLVDDPTSLNHPAVGELLQECVRLGFSRVEVRGPASWVERLSDRELVRLQGLSRVVLRSETGEGPIPAEATNRLRRLCKAEVELDEAEVSGEDPTLM